MKIERIEIFHVAMPMLEPFRTAFDDTYTIEGMLVKISGAGQSGWGESDPWGAPLYSGEWAGGVFAVARDHLAPRLLGREISSGAQLRELLAPFKGNYFAKAAFDLAWWDWHARHQKQPLWRLLGGQSNVVEVGADFGVVESVEELLQLIAGSQKDGFPRVKLKIKPGWDVEVLQRVRKEFPNAVFHVDGNSGYRLQDAAIFRALDKLGLAMFEQPLAHDDLLDHAKLAKMVETPICLDETITSAARAKQAIEIGACKFINIKPGRVGGMTGAVEILEVAREAGVGCWVGGMAESAIGSAHCRALASLPGMTYPADIFPTDRFYKVDLAERDVTMHAPGRIASFDGDGIGIVPDAGRLRELCVQQCAFGK